MKTWQELGMIVSYTIQSSNDRMRGFVVCFESKGLLAAKDLTRLALCRRIRTVMYSHFKSRAVKCLLLPETFIFVYQWFL